MRPIQIYTKQTCGYCHAAKSLLKKKNAEVEEISVDGDAEAQRKMSERAGGRWTVPQIFIGDTHVGGCDDLVALDRSGGLAPLLQQA